MWYESLFLQQDEKKVNCDFLSYNSEGEGKKTELQDINIIWINWNQIESQIDKEFDPYI